MSLCQYKDALGKPGEGVHAPRIFGLAAFDVIATLLAALAIACYFKQPFWKPAVCLFWAGVLLHRLFCVRTTVDAILF